MAPEAVAAFARQSASPRTTLQGNRALGELLLYQGQVDESWLSCVKAAALDPNDPTRTRRLRSANRPSILNAEAKRGIAQSSTGPSTIGIQPTSLNLISNFSWFHSGCDSRARAVNGATHGPKPECNSDYD